MLCAAPALAHAQQVPAIQPANLARMLDRAFSHHRRSGIQVSAAVSGDALALRR